MAISIDPLTYVIYVPKADLTLVQASPEIRALNVNQFRLWLKDYEDDPDYGIYLYKTHNHNTEVTLSGLTYARIVEVLAPYTVEFEDGQYAVNCSGANHNLADVKVANQVSLIINNAAGLITNAQIEFSSFGGGVAIDQDNITGKAQSGTVFPAGTRQQPCLTMDDALLIAAVRGLSTFYVVGDLDMTGDTNNYTGYNFVGESPAKTDIIVPSGVDVTRCEFYEAHVSGTLDGECVLKNCIVDDLNYINGVIEQCILEPGTITLGGSKDAYLLDCWSGIMSGATPSVDMGGTGQSLIVRNYNGYLSLKNLSDSGQKATFDLNSGLINLESSLTAGTITVRGVGDVDDSSGGATVDITGLVNPTNISSTLLSTLIDGSVSVKGALQVAIAALAGKASGGGTNTIIFRNAADDTNRVVMTVDDNGNRTSVTLNL